MHPNDPRNHPNFREHGEKKYYYTYSDIASLLNLRVNTVQHLVCEGKLDPCSLDSIVENYISRV